MIIATGQWNVPFKLDSPLGTIYFNQLQGTSQDVYLFDQAGCSASWIPRVDRTYIPQADGDIIHRHWKSGYMMTIALYFFQGPIDPAQDPACDADLVRMVDTLMLHLNAILRENGRVTWSPSGNPDRILNNVRLLTDPVPHDDGAVYGVSFSLLSPFPYAEAATEDDTSIDDGTFDTVTNDGNADTYPVFQVSPSGASPMSSFTLRNDTTGGRMVYDSSLPSAPDIAVGHYVEIDTFRNVMYIDGDQANALPGLVIPQSDFWPLVPGNNVVAVVGGDVLVKANSAWS